MSIYFSKSKACSSTDINKAKGALDLLDHEILSYNGGAWSDHNVAKSDFLVMMLPTTTTMGKGQYTELQAFVDAKVLEDYPDKEILKRILIVRSTGLTTLVVNDIESFDEVSFGKDWQTNYGYVVHNSGSKDIRKYLKFDDEPTIPFEHGIEFNNMVNTLNFTIKIKK